MKTPHQLERHTKGFSHHLRISILLAIAKNEGVTIDSLAGMVKADPKNVSQHVLRLRNAGLLNKKYEGSAVHNTLSPYGKKVIMFLKSF